MKLIISHWSFHACVASHCSCMGIRCGARGLSGRRNDATRSLTTSSTAAPARERCILRTRPHPTRATDKLTTMSRVEVSTRTDLSLQRPQIHRQLRLRRVQHVVRLDDAIGSHRCAPRHNEDSVGANVELKVERLSGFWAERKAMSTKLKSVYIITCGDDTHPPRACALRCPPQPECPSGFRCPASPPSRGRPCPEAGPPQSLPFARRPW